MSTLPLGWELVEITQIIASDGLFEDGDWIESKDQDPNGTIRLLQLADIGDGFFVDKSNRFINGEQFNRLRCTEVFEGDILIARMPDPLGRACITPNLKQRCVTVVDVAILRPGKLSVDQRWLVHFLNAPSTRQKIELESSGTTRRRIARGKLAQIELPTPPLNEQKRIADKLDSILARVDACRERLDRIPAILKRFRQAVLSAATSGKLTEDWRVTRKKSEEVEVSDAGYEGVFPPKWREVTFADVCSEITVGFVGKMSDQYRDTGVPFLRSMNVRAFRFDKKGLLYISLEFHKQIAKSILRPGDLAIVRSGAPGVCCVIPNDLPEANCSDLVIARPGPDLNPQYGCIFMNSAFATEFVNANKVGVAQAHFNVGSMKITPLPLPPIQEQTEIVRRVEELFAYADRIEARYQAARTRIEKLTPAVLAKAFRGELVPQDPNDEPASVLLERIQKALPATKQRGRSKANRTAAS